MKPQVDFIIPCDNKEGNFVIHFNTVEEIDGVINKLEECRAELEHQIEMRRIQRREAKKRRKLAKKNGQSECKSHNNNIDEFDKLSRKEKVKEILADYEKLNPIEKALLHHIIDCFKRSLIP